MRTPFTTPVRTGVALIAAAALVLVGACGDDGSSSAPSGSVGQTDADAGTRTVETVQGVVELPVDPERIVALDEYAALTLLSLGIEPAEVLGSYQSEVGQEVLADAGIAVEPASVEGGINFEAVAAMRPDVIVFTAESAFIGNYEQLSEIAPTIVLPFSTPWREVLTTTGEIFDRTEEADALIETLDSRLDEVTAAAEEDPRSISILANTGGLLFAASNVSPLSLLVEEVGFTRPVAQAEGEPDPSYEGAVMISEEVLGDHDADIVVVLSGAYYDAEAVQSLATYQALPAVQDGHDYVADGDMWFGSYPFAIFWILEDLEALQAGAGQDAIGTPDDAHERFEAFEELLG